MSCKLSSFYLFIDHNFNSHVTNELTLTLRADSLNQRVRYLRNGICLAQFDMSRWVLIRINLLSQIKILISGFFNFRFQRKRPTCEMDLKGESLEELFGCNLVTGLINAVKGSLVLKNQLVTWLLISGSGKFNFRFPINSPIPILVSQLFLIIFSNILDLMTENRTYSTENSNNW